MGALEQNCKLEEIVLSIIFNKKKKKNFIQPD